MIPLVGLGLGGPSFTPRSQYAASARLGEPVWGPAQLLRDLELRLALTHHVAPRNARVARYAARIADVGDAGAFYATSFDSDPIGTADILLGWRDALVEAGWSGHEAANVSLHSRVVVEKVNHSPANEPGTRSNRSGRC